MKKRIIGLLLAVSMVCGLVAGCGSSKSDTSASSDASASSSSSSTTTSAAKKSYNLNTMTWGSGAYPLEEIVRFDQYACKLYGMNMDIANNEFTADKVVSQLENQLAAKPDGTLLMVIASTTFEPCVSDVEAANIPYAFDSNFPDSDLLDQCENSKLCQGGVSADPVAMGKQMAEYALQDGNKTAIITAAAIGDYSHDNRIKGFTETFEAGGGKVLQVAHSSDPSEGVAKTNDLITAQPDADCVYAPGGDYFAAALSVKESRNLTMKIYGTDIDPSNISAIESGEANAMNGGQTIVGSIAISLIINALDGHPIKGSDGKPVFFNNLKPYVITKDNAKAYKAAYDSGVSFLGDENYNKLLYRNNPDVTVDTYNEVLENFQKNADAIAQAAVK